MTRGSWVLVFVCSLLAVGCTKTWKAQTTQPNPLGSPNETLRTSEQLVINTGDHELRVPQPGAPSMGRDQVMVTQPLPLPNAARFTVVSRDRLRVHVQVTHKWFEWVDLNDWDAYLVDDRGNRYEPVSIDRTRRRHFVQMWDYEQRTAVRNAYRDVVAVRNDRFERRQPLGSLSVFRGEGDFVFYAQGLFSAQIRRLTFVAEKATMRFEFTWNFSSNPDEIVGEIAAVR